MAEEHQTSGAELLAALGHRPDVRDVWFNRKTVTLDGFSFHNCRFDQCQLHVASTNFDLNHCFISDDTIIYFGDEVVKAVRLFSRRNTWIYDNLPYFAPARHEDGTISIA